MINDGLTRSAYLGHTLQQREEAMGAFKNLIEKSPPKRIIEIGTGYGGLTIFLRDQTKTIGDIYSFDILERESHKHVKESGVNFSTENIFKDVRDWNRFEVKEEYEELFKVSPKIVICDGGHKKGEFNGIAKHLISGDIIMLHDYSTNKETFDSLNVWNWLECQYSDIKVICEEYNLKPFMHEEFLNVAWGCFIKQ